jgi:hypothetical protein
MVSQTSDEGSDPIVADVMGLNGKNLRTPGRGEMKGNAPCNQS